MRAVRDLAALGAGLMAAAGALASPLTVTVTDSAGAPVAEAVVAVYVKGVHSRAAAAATAAIAQRDRQFVPSITVVQTGTPVLFPNLDTVRHHVYSFSPIQRFEIKLYAGVPSVPVVFDKPGTGALGCNIHDKMSAWIHVVDTPLFGKTNAAGQLVLDVPAGEHQIQAWSAALAETTPPLLQPLQMGAAAQVLAVRLPAPRGG
jgi:plastocyanin